MLVYTFYQRFSEAPDDLLQDVKQWLEHKLQTSDLGFLDSGGVRRGPGGVQASSPGNMADLTWSAFALSHGDSEVSGRLWRVSAGIRALPSGGCEASAITEVDDVSTLAAATPPEVTRPFFVTRWLRNGTPVFSPKAPSELKTQADLEALNSSILDSKRVHPILVVSTDWRGKPSFNLSDLEMRAEGLLQVVRVDPGFDTRQTPYSTQRWGVYRGGVALVFPAIPNWIGDGQFVPVERYGPDQLDALDLSNQDVARHLYHRFLHRTNLVFARLHLGPDHLQAARSEQENAALVKKMLESSQPTPDQLDGVRQLSAALDAANERARKAERKADEIEQHYYDAQQLADDAQAQAVEERNRVKALQAQFDQSKAGRARSRTVPEQVGGAIAGLLAQRDITPEEALRVVEYVFPDRVVVLDSAYRSAQEAVVFRKPDKVALRLRQLVVDYVDGMREGRGDRVGIEIFGKDDYAAKESEIREDSLGARRNRTFSYKGHDYYMERHLKIDNGRSAADGWRCHFVWLPEESRVVIGYCGKHLDFK